MTEPVELGGPSEGGAEAEEERYRRVRAVELNAPNALELLVSGLYDAGWRVRRAAAERLARIPQTEQVLPRLLAVLGDRGRTGARNAAADALVQMGTGAVPAILRLLADADPDQRKFAADILGGMALPELAEPLIARLGDADANVRLSIAEALGKVGGDAAVRALEPLLEEGALLCVAALNGFAQIGRPPPLPKLVKLLQDPAVRSSAYRVLGLIPEPAAVEMVCRGMSTDGRTARAAALVALGGQSRRVDPSRRGELKIAARTALRRVRGMNDLLSEALDSEDVELVRGALFAAEALGAAALAPQVAEAAREDALAREVVEALSAMGPAGARLVLERLSTLSMQARSAVAEALVALADDSLVPRLVELAGADEEELQRMAVRALGATRSRDAIEPLVERLWVEGQGSAAAHGLAMLAASFPSEVESALGARLGGALSPHAISAYARVAPQAAFPVLRRALRDASADVRAAAVLAAAQLGEAQQVELCRLGLADEAAVVRRAAAQALGALASVESGTLLRHALQDEDAGVQLAAVDAIGSSGLEEAAPDLQPLLNAKDGRTATHALHALARLGPLAGEVLAKAARHPDPEVAKVALQVGAASPEGAALAQELLAHERWDVRTAAARVLALSGGPEALEDVRAALERERDPLAEAAIREALAQLVRR